MNAIDLRSDTLTQPIAAMREAMAAAEVGDDVFGEDPTVNRLEALAARLLGKEAALFVASGTMANLVSLLTHCDRGDEVILGDQAHIFFYEQGGCAAVGGIQPRTVANTDDGRLPLDAVTEAIRPDDVHFPRTRLIALENTHNRCMGTPLDTGYMAEVGDLARAHGLRVHVDGARLFNAAVALGIAPAELVRDADSVGICLSKGLGAPVGSLVCGSRAFVARARRMRKILGGGMRQAGVLAAAGIVALETRVNRLADDHANAARLAAGLATIPGISVEPERIRTNIVFFEIDPEIAPASALAQQLSEAGVRVLASGAYRLRAVTHQHIEAEDIERALTVCRQVMAR